MSYPGQEFKWRGDPTWRDDQDWRQQARCRDEDPHLWFPANEDDSVAPGKHICYACPVRAACLDYAMSTKEPAGVWGGLDPRQREKLHRHRLVSTRAERTKARAS